MTLARDLAWQNLELQYQSSIARQFARYALGLNYESLPAEVVHEAKRCLLDTLGCAIGAYKAPGRPILEATLQELGGPEEATVFGSGRRLSAPHATLVNSFMVRFMDYMDLGGGGHNSEAIPGILAVAERERASGRSFLTALVISYELGARVLDSTTGEYGGFASKGWHSDIRGGLNMPPSIGRLMGLNEEQIANAIGICTSHALPLGILDADKEENVMSRNIRFGWVAHDAILSCMLARKCFTGPVRVVEGDLGFRQVLMQDDLNLERMVDFSGWRILHTKHKYLPANSGSQGHILATLSIVNEFNLRPEDIAAVRIKTGLRESRHTTSLPKKYPRSEENVDHSAFCANALAIKEGVFGPESADPEKFNDPIVLDLIEKITVEADPSLSEWSLQGTTEITTKDGRRFEKCVDIPHGFGDAPLTDEELEEKFRGMARKYMSDERIQKLFDIIWNVESLKDMGELTKLMAFKL
jgi:2-methylcitrate dehydratase